MVSGASGFSYVHMIISVLSSLLFLYLSFQFRPRLCNFIVLKSDTKESTYYIDSMKLRLTEDFQIMTVSEERSYVGIFLHSSSSFFWPHMLIHSRLKIFFFMCNVNSCVTNGKQNIFFYYVPYFLWSHNVIH